MSNPCHGPASRSLPPLRGPAGSSRETAILHRIPNLSLVIARMILERVGRNERAERPPHLRGVGFRRWVFGRLAPIDRRGARALAVTL